jgi:hypothetical protein
MRCHKLPVMRKILLPNKDFSHLLGCGRRRLIMPFLFDSMLDMGISPQRLISCIMRRIGNR